MIQELPSRYDPKATEDRWYAYWEALGLFRAKPKFPRKPFSIVIPPPNVTGILHMGHALNNTIQDILIRYHRMKQEESLWMPGTDHAGIATQNVVEKAIAKEGLKRQDLGREKFIERVWQWKEQYGSTIIRQLKKLGASCEWERTRFTMDEEYSRAVLEVFVRLYEKGLIYRGHYIINWCPRCQTALSDEEAPHHELQGNLYYVRYPLEEDQEKFVVVATTRPETMLGDTAVAVNPKDKRYKNLVGRNLILPLVGRKIKIIADSMVDVEFGTGAVKVTPAHDPNDYLMGKKHGLEFVNVMHPDGRMNENAGDYRDMDRFEARQVILEDLSEQGLLEKTQPHSLSAGHCYRCHTIIEPYLSRQWFVKMKPLAKPAIEAVKKKQIKFYPARWTKVYLNWMENIQDWCISRQIWWGHRIPVYYCQKCMESQGHKVIRSQVTSHKSQEREKGVIVSSVKPQSCPVCGATELAQDEDVLDTWFSSWLWPFATFYWPDEKRSKEDLEYFYPTSVLVTAPEIIFFWVARMIMAGLEFMGRIPFRDVYIHGTVRDIEGKKMSKSLGNIIDPLEIINEYGADALRFSLISITAQGQDVYLSKERFEQGRNFANKIWNAGRFILMNLEAGALTGGALEFKELSAANRWITSRLNSMVCDVGSQLHAYRFNEAANTLYVFFWHEFCDWYLEMIKQDIKNPQNQLVMKMVLENFLLCLHPFMPFITEELWHKVFPDNSSIMNANWPEVSRSVIDKKLEKQFASLLALVTHIRNLRAELELKPEHKATISIYPHTRTQAALLKETMPLMLNLARLQEARVLTENIRPAGTVSSVAGDFDVYLHFSGLFDTAKELAKIKERLSAMQRNLASKKARVENKEFLKKAPKDIVEKERAGMNELECSIQRLQKLHDELQKGER